MTYTAHKLTKIAHAKKLRKEEQEKKAKRKEEEKKLREEARKKADYDQKRYNMVKGGLPGRQKNLLASLAYFDFVKKLFLPKLSNSNF